VLCHTAWPILDTGALTVMAHHPNLSDSVYARLEHNVPMAPYAPGTRPAFLVNPSPVDERSFLIKSTIFSYCVANSTSRSSWFARGDTMGTGELIRGRRVIWVGSTRGPVSGAIYGRGPTSVRAVLLHAEDPKPIVVQGRVHAVFTRKSGSSLKQVWLAQLEPTVHEVHLKYPLAGADEANWVPIPATSTGASDNDALLLSYSLCPHRVLRCHSHTGNCADAYVTNETRCQRHMRGSTPMVHVGGYLLGVAHFKLGDNSFFPRFYYTHVFYYAQAEPPYALLNVSRMWRFPPLFGKSIDGVQYAAGLRVEHDRARQQDEVLITYGHGDCASFGISVPLHQVWRALGRDDIA
jgi:hypothetical protein